MNRLVIIGNGFDLAHGLPTSYRHFINDYWSNINKTLYEDEFVKLNIDQIGSYDGIKSYSDLVDILKNYFNRYGLEWKVKIEEDEFYLYKPLGNNSSKTSLLKFKNDFFRIICSNSVENWVDIENEYYKELKEIVKSTSINSKNKKSHITILNKEFEEVKKLLEKYLEEKIIIDKQMVISISNLFKINDGSYEYFLEFPRQDLEELEDFHKEYSEEKRKQIITYCLNFNYTTTIDKYIDFTKGFGEDRTFGQFKNLQIHGRLNDFNNRINFGFGDEMDDDYKAIENLDDNEYLRNFKSFQYLQNSNYKQLLDFVEGDQKFQVYIMGHSCGLSDRTMLNTVFEHPNCRSIKVFYHQREDGTDNYTEIIQNISRHFNKKKLMREKIVNKTLCQPLPQIKLPLK
jgi:hypothetical protein